MSYMRQLMLGVYGSTAMLFFFIAPTSALTQDGVKNEYIIKTQESLEKIVIDQNISQDDVIDTLKKLPGVKVVEKNHLVALSAFPTDSQISQQYYLETINARDAWSAILLDRQQKKYTRTSVIAILDTGVDIDHPDLKDVIWRNSKEILGDTIDNDGNGYIDDTRGWDFVANDNDPNPNVSENVSIESAHHGTLVAGIASASSNNATGIAGIGWNSKIMPLRVIDSFGQGSVFNVIEAIDYAIEQNVDVINMSFISAQYSELLFDAIKRAYDAGIVVVAAAGNAPNGGAAVNLQLEPQYPVCYDAFSSGNAVIGVASLDATRRLADFSNYGSGCIDIAAPGDNVFSTQVFSDGYEGFKAQYSGGWRGTSLSTPMVSGVVALLKSINPALTPDDVHSIITKSAADISINNPSTFKQIGAGLLDAGAAVRRAIEGDISQEEGLYLVAGLGSGSFPQVQVLGQDGEVFKQFSAYSPSFTGDIHVAVGDVNNDGKKEIITSPGKGGGPHVRIFDIEGNLISEFFAYGSDFYGGVSIAVGDVNNDGKKEIITGMGQGGGPLVKVFTYKGELISEFMAYSEQFNGGVEVATGNVNKYSGDEIITGPGIGGGPHVRVFNQNGQIVSQFFAFNKDVPGGLTVASGDLTGDGVDEIVTSIKDQSVPVIRVFNLRGDQYGSLYINDRNPQMGVYLSVRDLTGDTKDEIIVGAAKGALPLIDMYTLDGVKLDSVSAHHSDYRGGVRVDVY